MIRPEYRGARQWSRTAQAVATVAWISFLSAAVATMLFFAMFDPLSLAETLDDDLQVSRQAGYAFGFFFFWVLFAFCSGVTAWLVRTAPKRDRQQRG